MTEAYVEFHATSEAAKAKGRLRVDAGQRKSDNRSEMTYASLLETKR
jgi:hypothetical protein